MDIARYADSTGFEQDYRRPNAWRYRDYVIDAFNKDKPYNQFLREQIAGDEVAHVTDETLIATGFLRAGPRVQFREKDNPERRHDYLDDVLATIGRGVLGMRFTALAVMTTSLIRSCKRTTTVCRRQSSGMWKQTGHYSTLKMRRFIKRPML